MADPKTVSNLPVDVSIRWAEDQERLKETRPILTDASGISQHAQKDVTSPASLLEINTLLGLGRSHPTWALFSPPFGYSMQRRRLFTSQLAPFLGSAEQQEMLIARIEELRDKEEEPQKERIAKLLKLLYSLNRDLVDIISRCRQYQKG